jgi:hypothetical protein
MDAKISFSMLRTLSELVINILSVYDPDPTSGLTSSSKDLELKLTQIVEKSVNRI